MLTIRGCQISLLPLPGMDPDRCVPPEKGATRLALARRHPRLPLIRQAASRPHGHRISADVGPRSTSLLPAGPCTERSGSYPERRNTGNGTTAEISVATGKKQCRAPVPKKETREPPPATRKETVPFFYTMTGCSTTPTEAGFSLPTHGSPADWRASKLPLEDRSTPACTPPPSPGNTRTGHADELSACPHPQTSAPPRSGPGTGRTGFQRAPLPSAPLQRESPAPEVVGHGSDPHGVTHENATAYKPRSRITSP